MRRDACVERAYCEEMHAHERVLEVWDFDRKRRINKHFTKKCECRFLIFFLRNLIL